MNYLAIISAGKNPETGKFYLNFNWDEALENLFNLLELIISKGLALILLIIVMY